MNYVIIVLLIILISCIIFLYYLNQKTYTIKSSITNKRRVVKKVLRKTTEQSDGQNTGQFDGQINNKQEFQIDKEEFKEYPDITKEERTRLRQKVCPTINNGLSYNDFCKDPNYYINLCDMTSYYDRNNNKITKYNDSLAMINQCVAQGLMDKETYENTRKYYGYRGYQIVDYPTSSCKDVYPGNLKFCNEMIQYFNTCKTLENKGMQPNQYDIDNVMYCASRNLVSKEDYDKVKKFLKEKNINLPDMPTVNCDDNFSICKDPLQFINYCQPVLQSDDQEDLLEAGIISKDTQNINTIYYTCKGTVPPDKYKEAQEYFKNKGKTLPDYIDCFDKNNICKNSKNFIESCKLFNVSDATRLSDIYYHCGVNKEGTEENYKEIQEYFKKKNMFLPDRATVDCGVNMCNDLVSQDDQCFVVDSRGNAKKRLNPIQMTEEINRCLRLGTIIKQDYETLKQRYPNINEYISVNCLLDCTDTNDICKNMASCIKCSQNNPNAVTTSKLSFYNRYCPTTFENSYEEDLPELNKMYPDIFKL